METLPEKIDGIPTAKHCVKERFELVLSYYEKLWKDLQREGKGNSIHNKFLDAKRAEWKDFRTCVTQWEIRQYLGKH